MHDHQPGTVGEAESRADVAEQNDWNPDFEAELVGGEAGRVDGVKVLGRKHVGLCLVSHPIGGGVDKLFSGKGRHRMSEEGPSGHVNQRGRPMVLLPRVNAQEHQKWSRATQIEMGSVVHDVLLHLCCQECMWFGGL